MPDLADLEYTWSELEARADAYRLADSSTQPAPRSQRHLALVVGAGATVAAVAIGAVVLGTRSSSPGPSAGNSTAQHSTAPSPKSAVRTVTQAPRHDAGGWTTLPTGHYLIVLDNWSGARFTSVIGVGTPDTKVTENDNYQEMQIASPQGGFVVKVNPRGGWTPTGGKQVTVDGRPAYYDRFLLHPEIPNHPVHPRVALAWQYAPDTWATIASTSDTPIPLTTAEQLIAKLRIAVGDPIPSPPPQGK